MKCLVWKSRLLLLLMTFMFTLFKFLVLGEANSTHP